MQVLLTSDNQPLTSVYVGVSNGGFDNGRSSSFSTIGNTSFFFGVVWVNVSNVLVHEGVEAVDTSDGCFTKSGTCIATLVSFDNDVGAEGCSVESAAHDQSSATLWATVVVELLVCVEDVLVNVQGSYAVWLTNGVVKKTCSLSAKNLVDLLGQFASGWFHVSLKQVWKSLAQFAVLDHERNVQVLVERNVDVAADSVLIGNVVAIGLSLTAEVSRT